MTLRQWRQRARHLTPPHGPAYELFDASILLLVLGALGYIYTDPSATAREALEVPLSVESNASTWGVILSAAAIVGIVTSYRQAWLKVGYATVVMACTFWSICFVLGFLAYDASPRSLVSAVIYGWIARRLLRDGRL